MTVTMTINAGKFHVPSELCFLLKLAEYAYFHWAGFRLLAHMYTFRTLTNYQR